MTPEDKENLDRGFIERYPSEIYAERTRQIEKFGSDQVARKGVWFQYAVIGEEYGEVARALLDGSSDEHLRKELIETATCCLAMVQYLDELQDAENKRAMELRRVEQACKGTGSATGPYCDDCADQMS